MVLTMNVMTPIMRRSAGRYVQATGCWVRIICFGDSLMSGRIERATSVTKFFRRDLHSADESAPRQTKPSGKNAREAVLVGDSSKKLSI